MRVIEGGGDDVDQYGIFEDIKDDCFYAFVALTNGDIWQVESVRLVRGGWVNLVEPKPIAGPCAQRVRYFSGREDPVPIPFVRGVDVRMAQIAWVAKAPFGS